MNYFELHVGDYAEATSHLSILEDGVYGRLLRKYYAIEKPLPADMAQVQRLIGARTKEEKAAVEAVLTDFFQLRTDGWHNKRCDEEIAAFKDGEPEREVKKGNEDLRMRRHRQERAQLFQRLNAAGQHASWNTPIKELRELVARVCGDEPATETATAPATLCEEPATADRKPATRPATATATPATATQTPVPITHTPLPIHQYPIPTVGDGAPAPSAASPPPPFDGKNVEALNGKAIVPIAAAFELPEEWGIDAENLGFQPAEVLREAEKFRQYWVAGVGKGTRRSVKGWRQSWSNWLGKAAEKRR